MIPISDYAGFRQRLPVVNVAIVILNVLVFFYELSLPAPAQCDLITSGEQLPPRCVLQRFVYAFGAIPFELTHGADIPPPGPVPIYLTVFTSMFMHGGWAHILGNMLYLWVFGDNVEDRMGHVRYVIFYLLCGSAAVAAQTLIDVNSRVPSIGASGAIAGVLGAYLIMFAGARIRVLLFLGIFITTATLPALVVIGFWAITQFFTGLASLGVHTHQTGGVAYFAHIGGFIAGVVLVNVFRRR